MKDFLEKQWARIKNGDKLTTLVAINCAIFLLFTILSFPGPIIFGDNRSDYIIQFVYGQLVLSSDLNFLLHKPWTILTHLFVHDMTDVMHLIGNMFLLYFLGKIFLQFFTQKQLLSLYFLSGLVGAALLVLIANLSPFFAGEVRALGASAAVLGVAVSACTYSPNQTVFLFGIIKVPLKYIGLFLVISDFLFFYDGNTGGHIAHLGGAGFGYLFATQIRKGKDYTAFFSKVLSSVTDLFKRVPKKSKMKVAHSRKAQNMSDEEYNKMKKISQEEIDSILDKISKSGYDSLSKKEKEILFRNSRT